MATAAGTIAGHSYWNSGWIPSGSTTYGLTSSQTCYAGGSYPYVMKFTVPSVSGDLSAATLTFSLFTVKGSATSVSVNYRISASGKDGSTNTVPSGLVSGSVSFSGLTSSGFQSTFTTAAVNLSAGGTYYLWLHGGTYFQAYKHASYYSVALNYTAYTACGAPSSCSVSSTLSEGNVTLSWSGASNGTNNTISSYEIQTSESSNNSDWGSWTALTTVSTTATSGSISVSPSATRGYYRRYQVRTRGTAGSSYYSGWKVSTNSVRKNTLPIAPTSFSASPATYNNENVTLSWSGAAAGTSAIQQYVLQRSTSSDGSNWSAYETLTTITSSTTSGSYEATASAVAGTYTRYRISVTDTLGAVSPYVVSGTVKKNSPPAMLIITAPRAGSATYNPTPRFLITTGVEPDGQTQKVCVKIGAADLQDSVNNAALFSQGGYLGDGVKTIFRNHASLPDGSITVTFRSMDNGIESTSPDVNRTFSVLPSPFEIITENETKVKTEHIRAIRETVNTVRGYYGLTAASWSENIVTGKTAVKNWPYHILEIRTVLEGVISFINQFDSVSTFDVPEVDWLPLGTRRPRAAVVRQIQDLILTL